MTAFQRTIICMSFIAGLYWFVRWDKSTIKVVYPDNCVFSLDQAFSSDLQIDIKNFIDQAYAKNKNPSGLLPAIQERFAAIKSVIIDMHDPEVLTFSVQAYHPIFTINNEHVICQQGNMLPIAVFANFQLQKLENIVFDDVPTPKNIDRLVMFFNLVDQSIFKEFSVRWVDQYSIWLDQKEENQAKKDLAVLVGYDTIPNKNDVMQCQNLRKGISDKPCKDARGKPCKHSITWVCDLRFDRQIVLFSTNKGV